ncbi:Pumilio homology domain family member 4 [Diplonema papillatum]|nr:Pumilio homology domain family member 4 [Diplonema papillatum]
MAKENKIEEMIRADLGFLDDEKWSILPPSVGGEWDAGFGGGADGGPDFDSLHGLFPAPPGCRLVADQAVIEQQDVLSQAEHSGVQSGSIHFVYEGEGAALARRSSDPFPRVPEAEALRLEVKALERKLTHLQSLERSRRKKARIVFSALERHLMQIHDADAPPAASPAEQITAELNKRYNSLKNAARVKAGCVSLQKAIESSTSSQLARIAQDLLPSMALLANDFFGNYVVQCIIKTATAPSLILQLCQSLSPEFPTLAKTQTGTRVVQTLLGKCTTPEHLSVVTQGLSPCLPVLCVDSVGTYVVQKAVEVVPDEFIPILFNGLHGNLATLSQDKNGACCVRACVKRVTGYQRQVLLRELSFFAKQLSLNAYANYVVQAALEGEATELVGALMPHVVDMARDKFGSNVVEALLKNPSPVSGPVMNVIIAHAQFLASDTYGNFVVQTAAGGADLQQFYTLTANLQPVAAHLAHFKQGQALLQVIQARGASITPP